MVARGWGEKAMAMHSSTVAWKISWMEEPGGLQSMGLLRVGHNWATSLFIFHFHALEREMATHSSVLAWRIPGMGAPGGLPSMGSHRVGHYWSDLAAAAAGVEGSGEGRLLYSEYRVAVWDGGKVVEMHGGDDGCIMLYVYLRPLSCWLKNG